MLVVVPEILSMLAGTTVPENDAPAWDKAKAYKAGESIVQKHYVYRAIRDNTNVEPYVSHIGSSGTWQPVGTTNLYKCLDWYNYTQTVAPEKATEMTLVVPWERGSTAFALLNIDATSVRVCISKGEDVYFEQDYELPGSYYNWSEYFFSDERRRRNLIVTGLVPVKGQITVTLRGVRPKLGMLVVGRQSSFGQSDKNSGYGKTQYGASVRTVDYSKQDIDPDLGTVDYIGRYTSGRVSVQIAVHPDKVNEVETLLKRVKTQPALWLGDNGTGSDPLNVFGFLKDVENNYEGPNVNKYSLTVEGFA